MWRGKFISDLIRDLQLQNYLELGVAKGHCWYNVSAPKKVGVDLMNENVWKIANVLTSTTDDYFKSLHKDEKYDIVFIDADHNKESVKKDFFNSLKHLADDGIIVFHDVYPLQEENIEPHACGTAYAFWISLVNLVPDDTHVFIGDPGDIQGTVGVYYNSTKSVDWDSFEKMDHSYDYFYENLEKYILSKSVNYQQILEHRKSY